MYRNFDCKLLKVQRGIKKETQWVCWMASILVKDEIPVLGFPVTLGTSFLSDSVEKDIYPILKLKEQGALIVGKTNQHEMGIGTTGFNLLNGTPRNPYGADEHYYWWLK